MKRVGIITFQWYNNFGTLFQAFSLQEMLCELGFDAHVLPLVVKGETGIRRFVSKTFAGIVQKLNKFIVKHGTHFERGFNDFRSRYYRRGGYSAIPFFDLVKTEIKDDILVFGSDNIWSVGSLPLDYPGFKVLFGDGINHSNKVTYGASTAGYLEDHPLWQEIVDRIRAGGFRRISCREQYTVDFLNRRGVSATWVPDPVLLHTKEFWNRYNEPTYEGDYVLRYDIGHEVRVPINGVASKIGKKFNLSIRTPYPIHWFRDRKIAVYPTPQQWLGLFDSASFVVTNSFHGVVFALIYRKDFVYVPISGRDASMNLRANELLKKLDMEDRIVVSDNLVEEIDRIPAETWNRTGARLSDMERQGVTYLKNLT